MPQSFVYPVNGIFLFLFVSKCLNTDETSFVNIPVCPLGRFGFIYSYRRASTGFLVAARQLCQLTVSNVRATIAKREAK